MPLDTDLIIDRRRLKRRLNFWRVLAVLAVVLAAIIAVPANLRFHGMSLSGHIARIRIDGVIGDGRTTIESLDRLRKDSSVTAVLLHLDTPGGQVSGGEGIHDAVQALSAVKPVVAVMDGTAASAGYMIAVAAPHIVARDSTLTGSIGVILEAGNIGGLLSKIGVQVDPLVSGPLKGQPSMTEPMSAPARDYLQGIVGDLFDQFVGIVARGRHMDAAHVRTLADGRAYTGRQALGLGLVDEIGGDPQAVAWMEHTRHIKAGLTITDPDEPGYFRNLMANSLSGIITSAEQALRVDGAWSVWQPSGLRD
jgi:protease-4